MNYSTFLALVLFALTSTMTNAQNYYAVHSPDGDAHFATLSTSNGLETSFVLVTLNGNQVDGCTGMAKNPLTGDLYVVAKAGSVFTLATIDPSTGVCSGIAVLTEKFAGITFDDTGVLYGVTGDGANTPETVYSINTTTGALTLVAQPGTGFDGEAIAYNSNDGLLYRYGGGTLFQSIVPATGTTTPIFLDRPVDNFAHALVYRSATNDFLFAAGDTLYTLQTNGILQTLTAFDPSYTGGYKGLVSADVSSVEEIDDSTFELYPNPASDALTINVMAEMIQSAAIYASDGKLVKTLQLSAMNTQVVSIRDLPNGTYTLVLTDQDGDLRRNFVVAK